MSLTPYDLNPDHVWLEMPKPLNRPMEVTPSRSPQTDSLIGLNHMCEAVILPYLQEHLPDAYVPARQKDLWSLGINGIGVATGSIRLAFIPSEAWDLEGIQVPQEWVDSPDLVADYFVAVQVDDEDERVRLWGVTTHKTLKEHGQFIARNRSYILERDRLTETLNMLWLQPKYCPQVERRGEVSVLTAPSLEDLTQAWNILREPPLLFASRRIAFNTWASILANTQWRQRAIALVCHQQETIAPQSPSVQLSQWLNYQFEQGWQAINQLIAPQLVGAFMDTQIKRAKLIDLGVELAECQVSLMMTIASTEQGISVQASVYPTGEQSVLPPHLQLQILTESGEMFKEVTSRSDDEFIRYRFEAATGDRFVIQVALGAACVSESFQI